MQLNLTSERNSLRKSLDSLKNCLNYKKVKLPATIPQLLFVCGGNKNNKPSHRRRNLIAYTNKNINNVYPFLAEQVFTTLKKADPERNVLQIEQSLFSLADYIVIILESAGAFCELGAFSHQIEWRKKIVVINDENLRKEESFINTGPLELIENENLGSVLWYPMNNRSSSDNIGIIFVPFKNILTRKHRSYAKTEELINFKYDEKRNLLFLRDLITLIGPLTKDEIKVIINYIFENDYTDTLHTLIAVLIALEMIVFDETINSYKTTSEKLFYIYDSKQIRRVISSFKTYHLKKKRK